MKKIAIVTSGLKPVPDVRGGAVEHLTTVLINKNEESCYYQLEVYTLADILLDKIDYHNATLIQTENKQKLLPIRAIFSLLNRIFNLFHIKKHYDYMSFIIPRKVKGRYNLIIVENNLMIFFALKRRMPKSRIILHLHNDFDTVDTDYDKTAYRMQKLGEQATAIWAASHYLKRHLSFLKLNSPVEVLENCVEKERYQFSKTISQEGKEFCKEHGIEPNDFILLYSGRLDRWKGALEVMQAVEVLREKRIKLLIVGEPWFGSKEERQYVQRMKQVRSRIKDKIVFCGYFPQDKMQLLYQISDLVVIPSQCIEAFGMSALEAITAGKPCVASGCGGLLDVLDKKCAMLISQGEGYIERLADAIRELYDNPERLDKMGQHAKKRSEMFMGETEYYMRFVELAESAML